MDKEEVDRLIAVVEEYRAAYETDMMSREAVKLAVKQLEVLRAEMDEAGNKAKVAWIALRAFVEGRALSICCTPAR